MAKIPLIVHAASAAQLLPVVAWAAGRDRSRAGALIAVGALVGFLGDLVSRYIALTWGNNHITTYIDGPLMTVCFLAAFREWQVTTRDRRRVGMIGLLFLLGCVALVATIEDIGTFNFGIGPLSSLVLLGVAAWTLLRRASVIEQTPIDRTDWFWCAVGFAIFGAATALASPLGGLFLDRGRIDLISLTWQIRGAFLICAWALISWGIYRGHEVSRFATVE
jgi:hypothetical protein